MHVDALACNPSCEIALDNILAGHGYAPFRSDAILFRFRSVRPTIRSRKTA
jgi:hypothetical protein